MRKFRLLLLAVAAAAFAQTAGLSDDQLLFAEGQQRLRAGQAGMAKVTFETLIAVYPESRLVSQAREAIRKAEQQEPKLPLVRSIRFEHFRKVQTGSILQRLREREVALVVDRTYDPRDLEEARRVIETFLAESGRAKCSVRAITRPLPSHSIAVTFRLVSE